jgi:hypothetical protein
MADEAANFSSCWQQWSDSFKRTFRWWQELPRAGHLVPRAEDFGKNVADSDLENMLLIERVAGGNFNVLHRGKRINEYAAKPIEGDNYLGRFPPDQAAALGAYMTHIFGYPCGGDLTRTIVQSDNSVIRLRHLLLPMSGADGLINFVAVNNEMLALTEASGDNREAPDQTLSQAEYFDIGSGVPSF